jgi:Spy/CpxP family protein refolding chaperone
MKRLTLATAATLLVAQAALAQAPMGQQFAGPPPRGGPPIERLAADLGLDETQKAEVKRILEADRAKHESERAQNMSSGVRPTPEEMRAKMAENDLELTQQLSGVLTADQLAKFKALQEQRRQQMRNGPPPPPAE